MRTPLDGGESILPLCQVIQQFMPEKFIPAIATTAACLTGAKYLSILNMFGYCGVPMLTGAPVSCESEAAKCELALFSAHKSHCFNNQSTPSYFIKIVKKTTIPVVIDNISAKAAGMVEGCLLMPYNGTSRGTRSHGIDQPSPPTGNWELSVHKHIAEPYTLASMSTLMSQRQTCLRKCSKAGIELRHPLVKC